MDIKRMPGRENGKRRYFIYDLSTALEELRFTKAFGPGILAALFYGIISGSMSFVNKVVLTSYTFHFPNVLMLTQVIILSIVLEAGRLLGYFSIPKYTLERGKKFFIPSICFALHTTLALQALDYLTIPMYNVLRRLLPLTSLLFACFMLKKKPSLLVVTAVILVVVGCVTAGFGDLEFSMYAYVSALLSVVCQSFYLTYIQKTRVEEGLSTITVLYTNSINCVPLLLIFTLCNKELLAALTFDGLHISDFQAAFVLDVGFGCILSYSLFLCTTMNSALTTSLVGVVKGVLTTIIGFYTFGGVPVTVLTVIGVFLNTLGGALYSYAKYTENMASGIQKHFHKHTVKVNPATEIAEKKNNGMVEHNHKIKNGFVPEAVITINDAPVELDSRRASEDESISSSDSSVV
ncbi:hypothetical protein ACROYT_G035288 [Oculina patagonica]